MYTDKKEVGELHISIKYKRSGEINENLDNRYQYVKNFNNSGVYIKINMEAYWK